MDDTSSATPLADHAALVVEGEQYATALLDRIDRGMSKPGDLASVVTFLSDGPMLTGACRVIEKALGARDA